MIGIIFIFSLLVIGYIMWCSPLSMDDLYFKSFHFKSLSEIVQYVLKYGNGRFLGNTGVFYLLDSTLLRVAVKTIVISLVIFMITKVLDICSPVIYMASFVLILSVPPRIFSQVFSWTSGYHNYIPPVLCMLFCLYLIKNSTANEKFIIRFIKFFLIGLIGFSGQLFVEHSTIINIAVAVTVLIFLIKSHGKNKLLCAVWLGTGLLGAITMFLIPRLFYMQNEWTDFQKINVGSISALLDSVNVNIVSLSNIFSDSYLLWSVLAVLMLFIFKKYKKVNQNIIIGCGLELILLLYPIYSIFSLCFFKNPWYAKYSYLIYSVSLDLMLIFIAAVMLIAAMIPDKRVKYTVLICFGLGLFSVAPLLFVSPVGARCLFHSYVFFAGGALVLLHWVTEQLSVSAVSLIKKTVLLSLAVLSGFLILTFYNIHTIDAERTEYIESKMKNGSNYIDVPVIPYTYCWDNGKWSFSQYYYYEKRGDIDFYITDYYKWYIHTQTKKIESEK